MHSLLGETRLYSDIALSLNSDFIALKLPINCWCFYCAMCFMWFMKQKITCSELLKISHIKCN